MKTKSIKLGFGILAIVLIILISGCTASKPAKTSVSNPAINNKNLRIAEVYLPGMFCISCARSAAGAFKSMPGVVSAKVNIKTKKGTIIYNPAIITEKQLVHNSLIQAYNGKILSDKKYIG